MADALVNRIDDGLPVRTDVVDIVVQVENPIERLRRRHDVVALGAEYDDRRADIAQVERRPVAGLDPAGSELVADEEFVDDELDFLGIEVHMAAPPALE